MDLLRYEWHRIELLIPVVCYYDVIICLVFILSRVSHIIGMLDQFLGVVILKCIQNIKEILSIW